MSYALRFHQPPLVRQRMKTVHTRSDPVQIFYRIGNEGGPWKHAWLIKHWS